MPATKKILRTLPVFRTDDEKWQAVLKRDSAADEQFYYSVRTTGVYCRPSCAARLARRENVRFHATIADAENCGFRACKRCKPKDAPLRERHRAGGKRERCLGRHIAERIRESTARYSADQSIAFGRRLGWYAFVRILKPRVVVETGVDKGLGAVALCAALLRNEAEGTPGQYFGADINPRAGVLLSEPYTRVGKILYGDSIQSLQSIPMIDMFVNDSDHSAAHERQEYDTIAEKLGAGGGLILGDNSHCTDVLAKFSAERGRQFIFFREQPKDHWYPGAGIGISFLRKHKDSVVALRASD